MELNENEVMNVKYVDAVELKEMFEQASAGLIQLTPWFRMICDNFLYGWWEKLDALPPSDYQTIHHLTL